MYKAISLSLNLNQDAKKRTSEPSVFQEAVDLAKRKLLEETIAENNRNLKLAREALGLSESTFWRMRRKYGLQGSESAASRHPKAKA